MLDAVKFAEALRAGVARSGLAGGKPLLEAGYVSLAGSVIEYLKANLEVTVRVEDVQAALREGRETLRATVR